MFSIFRVGIFSSCSVFSLVSGAFTLTFRRVQRFVYLATRGRPQQSYGLRIVDFQIGNEVGAILKKMAVLLR